MSRITMLTSSEDLAWLKEVHLGHIKDDLSWVKVAALYGNEDSPKKVELFERNHYQCVPVVFEADEDGTLQKQLKQ